MQLEPNTEGPDTDTIIAVPAGYSPDEQFVKNLRQGWDKMIFGEVLKKCSPDTVPALFDTKPPSHPQIVRMPLNVCKLVAGTVLFAAIGGQPLSLVTGFLGAKIGELIGLFTPRVGAGLGVASSPGSLGGKESLVTTACACAKISIYYPWTT